jgi:RNA polymerase sigma-70 factor, ECF subfamily
VSERLLMAKIDPSLIRRAQSGDREAVGFLYDSHVRQIYQFIWFKTRHRETAEDITTTVFMAMVAKLASYREDKGEFIGWLFGIARRAVADHYRNLRPTQSIEDVWDMDSQSTINDDVDNKLVSEELKQAMQKLTALQRDVIVMRIWQELTYAEIATALGKSEGSCKMAYARGIEAMRLNAYILLILFFKLHS